MWRRVMRKMMSFRATCVALVAVSVVVIASLVFGIPQYARAATPTIGYVPGYGYVISYVTRLLAGVQIGPKGSLLSNGITVFSQTITPTATAAAIGTVVQTATVTGLATGSIVHVMGPTPTALCPLIGAFVSATNTLSLEYSVMTAAACTPASGTYKIVAIQ
jgi:hypothetical protein